MDWQTTTYFSSIVLTFVLTGFLAWVAWKHPPLPGVRAYAVFAFAECLLSFVEILSLVSPRLEQAQFWFNICYAVADHK